MRIKRFNAPDMRTALRMVREEQGADAVILSSRQSENGIEVVAATDYDEAVVQQALRTMGAPTPTLAAPPLAKATITEPPIAESRMAEPANIASALRAPAAKPQGRAVFQIDGEPVAAPSAPVTRTPSRLEQVMAVLKGPRATPQPVAATGNATERTRINLRIDEDEDTAPVDFASLLLRADAPVEPIEPIATIRTDPSTAAEPAAAIQPAPAQPSDIIPAAPALRAVEADPAMTAMRAELTAMRKVIERELGQLSADRMRGSPARAAALDALAAFGCDDGLAQRIATSLNPALPLEAVAEPLRASLATQLPVLQEEAIEQGGTLAVLGPTGAGKTTTIAKLAARYAARHRARDVAMVSADNERAGAREQLHVLGRRLGVTVCDADGPDALARVLEQLADYPLVLIDTAGYGLRDRALLRQILWVRAASNVRSLLVLPANAHPADLAELLRRYRPAAPEGVILTKLDESTCVGAALSVLVQHGLPLAYTTAGQCVPDDIELADPGQLAATLDFPRRSPAANTNNDEGQHAVA